MHTIIFFSKWAAEDQTTPVLPHYASTLLAETESEPSPLCTTYERNCFLSFYICRATRTHNGSVVKSSPKAHNLEYPSGKCSCFFCSNGSCPSFPSTIDQNGPKIVGHVLRFLNERGEKRQLKTDRQTVHCTSLNGMLDWPRRPPGESKTKLKHSRGAIQRWLNLGT